MTSSMKLLTIDLEIAPNLGHVWGLWNQNIGLSQLIASAEMLCGAAKWHHEDKVHFWRGPKYGGDIQVMWDLVNEADALITWNGDKFDIPHMNREFIEHGMAPPEPYASIDLLKTSRKAFYFPSNKLDYVATRLLGEGKHETTHELWIGCMAGDEDSWETMMLYNKQDVRIEEKLYDKLLPWILRHPNIRLYDDAGICPRCGADNYHKRGFRRTDTAMYQRYQCQACKGWFSDGKRVGATDLR